MVKIVLILISALTVMVARTSATKPPHIMFILMDDLGWSDVGYHNISHAVKTPNIDKLASQGVKLMSYYSQPMCTPSRGALMTGKYPIHLGMQHFVINITSPWGMPRRFPTIPQKLRTLGYRTSMIGKWHLGFFDWDYTPLRRGFDSFLGFFAGEQDHWRHSKMGFLDFRRDEEPANEYGGQHSTDVFTQEAINIAMRHNASQPLFLLLSYAAVHTPLQAHPNDVNKIGGVSDKDRQNYLGMMGAADWSIGRLIDVYKRNGLWNNTLMIWASDNGAQPGKGGGYNWPLRGYKSSLFEGGVRVPAFVHGEMLQRKGGTVNDLFHVTDWYPTLVKLAGGEVEPDIDGVDQWPTLSEGKPSKREEILHNIDIPANQEEERMAPRGFNYYSGAALRRGHMKLVYKMGDAGWYQLPENGHRGPVVEEMVKDRLPIVELALYNITADPEERNDLSKLNPDIVDSLWRRLQELNATSLEYRLQPEDPRSIALAERLGRWEPWLDEDAPVTSYGRRPASCYIWLLLIGVHTCYRYYRSI
ncbi:arylsulfatase B [Nematostella vectensis]|uniref:arylsulfatase B n=1 Tax=Nematostella vectensis TaxID=45351 RepID=UPI00139003C9|nr:arylsulfatase B [Nematostella vectensis]